jgi:peptidoglycan/LPS O-acetylase OafA/YrhL
MSKKSGHSKHRDSQNHDEEQSAPPDAISDSVSTEVQSQPENLNAKSEVEAARNLFARASQQGLPAIKKEISPEAKAAVAQYFSMQNGQTSKGGAAETKTSGESDAMSESADQSLNDFTPPDDDGIAAITGSHKRLTPESLQTHHIEAAIRGESAAFSQTQVDQDVLPDGSNEALNQALGQALNRALNASPAKGLRKNLGDVQPPLVTPHDASKRGFIDAFKSASKASRINMQATGNLGGSRSQMPAQSPHEKFGPAGADSWQAESGKYNPDKGHSGGFKNADVPSNRPIARQEPIAPMQAPMREQKVHKEPAERPVRGTNAEEKQTNWPQQAEFDRARAIWAEQVGAIKAQPARRNSANVARNLRSIMTTGICNVREVYSLRGLACLMVFMTQAQFFTAHVQPTLPLSTIAAQLFFVMSGFFVTRSIVTNETPNLGYNLSNHYARRAMGILPMYFGALAILLAWGHLPFPETFFSGLFNYKLFELNHNLGAISQYWTMCVELQFYLIFPFVLLLTPKKMRLTMLVVLTGLSALAGYTSAHTRANSPDYLLLPIAAQFLLLGALVGYIDSTTNFAIRLNGTKCFLLGLTMQISLQLFELQSHVKAVFWPELLWKDHALISAVACALMVVGLWRSASPALRSIFNIEALVYLGKISYGFYLLLPVSFILQPSISALAPQIAKTSPIAVSFGLNLILSIVAYQYLQRPILNMRPDTPQAKNKYALRG